MKQNITIVILAAGMGTRLGKPHPKCLTVLENGETIMGRQLRLIKEAFGSDTKATIVVGYQSENIIEQFPNEIFIHNTDYDVTNTSKSLLKVIAKKHSTGVLWLNGDVVFDEDLMFYIKNQVDKGNNFVTVNNQTIGEEEVKYTLTPVGAISSLAKTVPVGDALGEAVGINFVNTASIPNFRVALNKVGDHDYFEKGIELTIANGSTTWLPFDITRLGLSAVEVDFGADLETANEKFFAK